MPPCPRVLGKTLDKETKNSNQQVFDPGEYRSTSGRIIPDVRTGYATCGTLSREKDNAVLVCHYFSGNAHAAGPSGG